MNYKPIIAVDFDGVICENVWPEKGRPIPGALDGLARLREKYRIVIWTSREKKHKQDAIDWLAEHGVEYDAINEAPFYSQWPQGLFRFLWSSLLQTESKKTLACVYIDDRNLGGFPGWPLVIAIVNRQTKPARGVGGAP